MPAYNMPRKPISPHSSRRALVDCINQAFETADVGQICQAIGAATRLYNISDLAQGAGLERQSIYRAFLGGEATPNFKTALSVLDAIGFSASRHRPPGRSRKADAVELRSG